MSARTFCVFCKAANKHAGSFESNEGEVEDKDEMDEADEDEEEEDDDEDGIIDAGAKRRGEKPGAEADF